MTNANEIALVLTVEDLARILAISKNTAYELVRSRKIRSVKIGRTYRIPRSALQEYLNSAARLVKQKCRALSAAFFAES